MTVGYDFGSVFESLMGLNGGNIDFSKILNDFNESPTDWAQKYGRWEIFEKILFAKMGDKMKEKAEFERKKVEKQNGIVRQFLKIATRNKNNDEFFNQLESILIELIEKRLPISDDMLLLSFIHASLVSFCCVFCISLHVWYVQSKKNKKH